MKSSSSISGKKYLTEEKISGKVVHKGGSFSFCSDSVKLPDGRDGIRNYVNYPEAAAIVPFIDPDNIIMVEQFRYPAGKILLEIPAGKLENPEETKMEAAQRELLEETGYRAKKMSFLFSYYPCAGYSTEILHIFQASELIYETQGLDDDEFIEPRIVSFKQALEWIKKGEITDSKTIISLLHIYSFR